MKLTLKQFASALLALAIIGTSVTVRAADEKKAADKAEKKAEAPAGEAAKVKGTPYRGTIVSVDKTAMTVTVKVKVAEKTFTVTSTTKITNATTSKPATIEDVVVGEPVSVYYKTDSGDKPEAISLKFGKKPAKEGEAKPDGEKKPKKEKKTEGEAAM